MDRGPVAHKLRGGVYLPSHCHPVYTPRRLRPVAVVTGWVPDGADPFPSGLVAVSVVWGSRFAAGGPTIGCLGWLGPSRDPAPRLLYY